MDALVTGPFRLVGAIETDTKFTQQSEYTPSVLTVHTSTHLNQCTHLAHRVVTPSVLTVMA